MSGGLMQLVAYGAQDIYLSGNPSITFHKVVYRRHTNFAIESIEQTFSGQADFGNTVTATISRNGDLIGQVMLEVELPALQTSYLEDPTGGTGNYDQLVYANSIGHVLIKECEIDIGGQKIDKHYGVWMEIWDELTQVSEKEDGFNQMIGKQVADIGLKNTANISQLLFIPLMFWFNRNPGLALPLIALQYHEVKIKIQFRSALECLVALQNDGDRIKSGSSSLPGSGFVLSSEGRSAVKFTYANLWVDYVFLDTEERRRFAQESHEYLIDQLQESTKQITLEADKIDEIRLNFNHPTKELIWVFQRSVNAPSGGNVAANDWFNFSTSDPGQTEPVPYTGDLMSPARQAGNLRLNGQDRFAKRSGKYFRLVQPYKHHTGIPSKHIYVYSFGIRPEDHQPSGSINFSRIDNAQLHYTLANNDVVPPYHSNPNASPYGDVFSSSANGTVIVYARNYNVLRIMSGMGGLAYSS